MSILSWLEPDHNTAVVAEVTLIVVALSKVVAEPSQYKIKLRRANSEVLSQGNIETSANHEIPGIVARVIRKGASTRIHANVMEQVVVGIGVGAAKECFHKGFPMLSAVFENRTHVVGEQIAARFSAATCRARTRGCRRENEGSGEALIAIKFTGEPQPVVDVKGYASAPTVQGEAANDVAVLRVEPHEGVLHGDFNPGVILSKGRCSEQQNNSQHN